MRIADRSIRAVISRDKVEGRTVLIIPGLQTFHTSPAPTVDEV
jgi:hypothetical protein